MKLEWLRNTLLALTLLCLGSAQAQAGHSADELKLFNLVNQERAKAGLPALEWDSHLAETARAHTKLQANQKTLSHQLPGELVLSDRVAASGLRFDIAAENVAEGDNIEQIHQGLMDSPKHRSNI